MKKSVLTLTLFLMYLANGAIEVFSLPVRARPEDGAVFHAVGPYLLGGRFADQRQRLPNVKKDGCYEVSFNGKVCTVQPFKRNGLVSGICLIYSMRNSSVDAVKRVATEWASLIERTYNLEMTPYWNGITSCAFSFSNERSNCPKTATRIQGDYYKDTAMGVVSLLVSCDNSFSFTPMMFQDEDAIRHLAPTVEWLGLTDWVNRHLPRAKTNDFQKVR